MLPNDFRNSTWLSSGIIWTMGFGVGAMRKEWLSIAALSVICACTPAAFAGGRNHLRNRIDPRIAWAVADFNGDRRLDLITASSTRNLSGSYTYDIQVALGGPESGSLSFASADAHSRLQAC